MVIIPYRAAALLLQNWIAYINDRVMLLRLLSLMLAYLSLNFANWSLKLAYLSFKSAHMSLKLAELSLKSFHLSLLLAHLSL